MVLVLLVVLVNVLVLFDIVLVVFFFFCFFLGSLHLILEVKYVLMLKMRIFVILEVYKVKCAPMLDV